MFFENAGGSQTPDVVCDAIHRHMLHDNAQLGAGYPRSSRATATVEAAHQFMLTLMNGNDIGEVVMGASSSALLATLGQAMGATFSPGDRIIIDETCHEAQVGPWIKLKEQGIDVVFWRCSRDNGAALSFEALQELLIPSTKLVAVTHVSNLLGAVLDLHRVVQMAHRVGAKVVADGVAYAPHRAIDVKAWGVDFYVFSNYKVYGAHGMATLFGRHEAFRGLTGPNHFFIPSEETRYKFELGGVSHEGCAGVLALRVYLNILLGRAPDAIIDREVVEEAFSLMRELEAPLTHRLESFLSKHSEFSVVGPSAGSGRDRELIVNKALYACLFCITTPKRRLRNQ
eukprot:gene24919-30385_t